MTNSNDNKNSLTQPTMPLLSAYWRNLIVINYEINPVILKPMVPQGTELDYFERKTFISLVGFLFQKTKLFGFIPIFPFSNFEEINLRFYIRKKVGKETRRAVCFIREIVPFAPIAWGARVLYNEPYVTKPTRHRWFENEYAYQWKIENQWVGFRAITTGNPIPLRQKSIEEFILEHYWGYTQQKDGSVKEYEVRHEPWNFWKNSDVKVDKEINSLYGGEFLGTLKRKPHSAFVAEGSKVGIYPGRRT